MTAPTNRRAEGAAHFEFGEQLKYSALGLEQLASIHPRNRVTAKARMTVCGFSHNQDCVRVRVEGGSPFTSIVCSSSARRRLSRSLFHFQKRVKDRRCPRCCRSGGFAICAVASIAPATSRRIRAVPRATFI